MLVESHRAGLKWLWWQLNLGPAIDGRQGHFSQVDLSSVDQEAVAARFPRMVGPGRPRPIVAELMAGDILFIPAGWFHEVTSFDTHMALNFWCTSAPQHHSLAAYPPSAFGAVYSTKILKLSIRPCLAQVGASFV